MSYKIRHTGTIEIETDRLLLRPILLSDAQSLYEIVSDKDVLKYLAGLPEYTGVEMAVDYISGKLEKKYQNKDFYDWAVVLKSENKMIGRISVYKQDDYRRTVHPGKGAYGCRLFQREGACGSSGDRNSDGSRVLRL